MTPRGERSPNRRLAALARMIPPGSRVADIGTDHGRLPLLLLRSGRCRHCIATEVSEAALATLRRALAAGGIPEGLELRAGKGLMPIHRSDRVDLLVLAGMGASTLRGILLRQDLDRLGIRRTVLQPQTDPAAVRRHLCELGLRIVEESLLRRGGNLHLLLAAETGHRDVLDPHPDLGPEDLMEAGPCLVRDGGTELRRYWLAQRDRNDRILAAATPGPARREARRVRDLAARILEATDQPSHAG